MPRSKELKMGHRERLLEALKLEWPKDGDVETAGAGRIQEVNVALGFPRLSGKQLSIVYALHVDVHAGGPHGREGPRVLHAHPQGVRPPAGLA
jgi:hypothetical protein